MCFFNFYSAVVVFSQEPELTEHCSSMIYLWKPVLSSGNFDSLRCAVWNVHVLTLDSVQAICRWSGCFFLEVLLCVFVSQKLCFVQFCHFSSTVKRKFTLLNICCQMSVLFSCETKKCVADGEWWRIEQLAELCPLLMLVLHFVLSCTCQH